jgi:DNA transformation protein
VREQKLYLDFVLEALSPLGDITSRAMFGGYCLYCGGVVFALIAKGVLYLKTDDDNRAEFEAKGLKRFVPFENKDYASMNYCEAPAEIFEDENAMRKWVGGAIAAGKRKQSKKRR